MVVDTILFGDCRETLKEFDGKARTCVTSPPYYGLRNYVMKKTKQDKNKHQKNTYKIQQKYSDQCVMF